MKLHVKCDRCGAYVEATQEAPQYPVRLPEGWTHLRFFGEPISINCGLPEGSFKAELCPTCTTVVEKAARAALARQT